MGDSGFDSALQYALNKERAATLGLTGRRLEAALTALAETPPDSPERPRFAEAAARRLWEDGGPPRIDRPLQPQ